jgi:hypothetical protein
MIEVLYTVLEVAGWVAVWFCAACIVAPFAGSFIAGRSKPALAPAPCLMCELEPAAHGCVR